MESPPPTRRDDTSYELHGHTIDDPYLWLESDSDAVSDWVDEQNAYADAYLENVPEREALREPFEEYALVPEFGTIVARPGRYFQEIERAEDDQPILTVRSALDEPRTDLIDPNGWSDDGTMSMGWWAPSPTGDRVAYAIDEGGEEQFDVAILDVESREVLETLTDLGRTSPPAWTPDGVYYTETGSAADGGQLEKAVRYHTFGSDQDDDPVVAEITDPGTWPMVTANRGGTHVLLVKVIGWERAELYTIDPGTTEPEPLLVDTTEMYHPLVSEDTLYLRTTHGADGYRVVSTELDNLSQPIDPSALTEVIPEQEGIINDLTISDSYLIAKVDTAAVSSLECFDLSGTRIDSVSLPGTGTVEQLAGNRDHPEVFFTFEAFDHPTSVERYDPDNTTRSTLDQVPIDVDLDIDVSQTWVTSADGTEIPAFIVHEAGQTFEEPAPTVLYGYGGYEISLTPSFVSFGLEFLRAGGVFVQANLRGGGEFGKEWHHAARHDTKQRTFDDMIAVAEYLIDEGYTDSSRLAIQGGSNGGLTVGAVMTQRPELVGAVLCHVPLLDMLRFHKFLLGDSWTTEYGSPDDPDAFEWIREYSPYHNLEEREYPAVLFKTAEGDTRVHPVHAWKMAARMQSMSTGDRPSLCKTNRDTGHGTGKPTWMIVEEALDTWSFVFEELDVAYEPV